MTYMSDDPGYCSRSSSPEKQRTLTILSAIMNFLHFRKQRMEIALEKQAKFVCYVGPVKCGVENGCVF